MMVSERRTLESVSASALRGKTDWPDPLRRAYRLARGAACFGAVSLLCFAALTNVAAAKGTLWLVGDKQLNVDQLGGKNMPAKWVDELVFPEIISDGKATSGGSPDVLVVWVNDDPQLKKMTEEAFSKAGAASVVFKEASSLDGESFTREAPCRRPCRRDVAPERTASGIIWLMDGEPEDWMDALTDVGEQFIKDHFLSGGVVGGQGRAATLFGDVFLEQPTSETDQLANSEALADAYHADLVLVKETLLLLPGTLIDSEFLTDGRIGRLPVVLARADEFLAIVPGDPELTVDLLGIGVDDKTALRVDGKGIARVLGGGSVTLQHRIYKETVIDLKGNTPHITDLQHHQLTAGYEYDIDDRTVTTVPMGAQVLPALDSDNGANFTETFTPLASGGNKDSGENASVHFPDPDGYYSNSDAIFMGEVIFTPGTNALENFVYSLSDAGKSTQAGTHLLALAEGLVEGFGRAALWVPPGASANVYPPATIESSQWLGNTPSSVLVIDSFMATSVAFSNYVEYGATNAQQSVAITGARLHVIGEGESVDLTDVASCELPIDADLNGDGTVDVWDVQIAIIAKVQNPNVPPGTGGDLNCDGFVDLFDVYLAIDYALGLK